MFKIRKENYTIRRLDHLGIVSGIMEKIGIRRIIDAVIPPAPQRKLSVGTIAEAMVLNGLGFVGRALYLTPQFFESKDLKSLLGVEVTPEDLNETTLGRGLDDLYEGGLTSLFSQIASSAYLSFGWEEDRFKHLDTSSFTLTGEYREQENKGDEQKENPKKRKKKTTKEEKALPVSIRIAYGYSKDHRPDQKQFVLGMITRYKSSIPVWMESQNGNANDSKVFAKAIESYLAEAQKETKPQVFVMDSSMYTSENLEKMSKVQWVTRVPERVGAVRKLLRQIPVEEMTPSKTPGYFWYELGSTFNGYKQRWLFVHSEKAFEREKKTLLRRIAAEKESAEKALKKLMAASFFCETDARSALTAFEKEFKYHALAEQKISPVTKYEGPGRPAEGEKPNLVGYSVTGRIEENKTAIDETLATKGTFVIATNILESDHLSNEDLLDLYKAQGTSVERGFRFLKDPLFFADAFFLKKPERIMALTVTMGLSLLVYALAEKLLREKMAEMKKTVKNQKRKPTERPTLRWVFMVFEGINVLYLNEKNGEVTRLIQLTEDQRTIIELLGPEVQSRYCISEEAA